MKINDILTEAISLNSLISGKVKTYLVGGAVRDQLLKLKSKDKDWVVVGSTAERVLDHLPCDVLIVRADSLLGNSDQIEEEGIEQRRLA